MNGGHDPISALFAAAGYEQPALIGRGASTTVYRVRRLADGRSYALKLLDEGAPEALTAAFRKEAVLLAGVDHPNLLRIHETGQVGRRAYLVMDLIDGVTLASLLQGGPLSASRTISLARDVIGPLAATHRAGIVHRDIKPHNLLIDTSGQAWLIDFGLAARNAGTQANVAVGTLTYAPPEQSGTIRRPVDARSDLYSLGVVLFECLTARAPFMSDDVSELLRMHSRTPAPDLRQLVPDTPAALAAIVATLLAKDPDDRYESAAQLAADLEQVAEHPDFPLAARTATIIDPPGSRRPLIGRQREWEKLRVAWNDATQGKGRLLTIGGGTGTGKTSLITRFATEAETEGGLVLEATAVADSPIPLDPFHHMIDAHLDRLDRLDEPARSLAHQYIRECAGTAAPVLASLTPKLATVLGHTGGVGAAGQDQFTMAVAGLLVRAAERFGPVLLIIDDAQWADPGTNRVLHELVSAAAAVPMLIVLTINDDHISGSNDETTGGASIQVDIELAPLNDGGTAELAVQLLPGSRSTDPVVCLLVARSGGNPLVAVEYVRAIIDTGLLRPCWGRWELDERGLADLALPGDALGLLTARIDHLDTWVQELLTTAAVAGSRFDAPLLAAVHDLDEREVGRALADATAHGLIEMIGSGYAFLHGSVREALTVELSCEQTARLHGLIADAIERISQQSAGHDGDATERLYALAHHYLAAGEAAPAERAFPACEAAGRLALSVYSPGQAVRFLGHAVDLSAEPAPSLLLAHAQALQQVGRYDDAIDALHQALARELAPLQRAELLATLAGAHRATWNTAEGWTVTKEALSLLGASTPERPLDIALTTIGRLAATPVVRWLRRRWPLDAQRRPRYELLGQLHATAGELALFDVQPPKLIANHISARYWVTHVGAGPWHVRVQSMFGMLCASAGQWRAAERSFRRVQQDPATGADPSIGALGRVLHAYAGYLGYQAGPAPLSELVQQEGQWLDLADYAEVMASLITDAIGRGRSNEADRLWASARHRMELAQDELSALDGVPASLAVSQGRYTEAAELVRQLARGAAKRRRAIVDCALPAIELVSCRQQGEIGKPFDAAVTAFERFGLPPKYMPPPLRMVLFNIAVGRVAQLRGATGADRKRRLAQARTAIRQLGQAARDDLGRSWHRIARADLLVTQGSARQALRLLDGDEAILQPPAPLIRFEALRVRAGALAALGDRDRAHDQLALAAMIASEHGWPHRISRLIREHPDLDPSLSMPSVSSGRSGRSLAASAARITPFLPVGAERERLEALQQVSEAAGRVLDPDALARIALDQLIALLRADRAFLFLSPDDGATLAAHAGRDSGGGDLPQPTGYSTTLVDEVRVSRQPIVITGTEEGAAMGAESVVLHGLRSIIAAPLLLDERLLGVVYLDSQVAKGIFTADDVGILTAVTSHIALSLETARAAQLEISVQTARHQRDVADQLRQSFEAMAEHLDPDTVVNRLLQSATSLARASRTWLVTAAGSGVELTEVAEPAGPGTADGGLRRCSVSGGPTLDALLNIDGPMNGNGLRLPAPLDQQLPGATGWAALPLRSLTTDLGVLVIATTTPDHRLGNELDLVAALAAQGLTAYDNATLLARLQDLARRDELTGIPNRRHFFELASDAVAECRQREQPVVAMMVDIDHFKKVNDTYGHPAGDDVIRVIAARLGQQVRPTDVFGRYGGEEFAVLAPDADLEAGYTVAERLRQAVALHPVRTRAGSLTITVSIGIAELQAEHVTVGAVLADADRALYEAKQTGRNQTRCLSSPAVATGRAEPGPQTGRTQYHSE